MKITLGAIAQFGFVMLFAGGISSAMAYQQDKPVLRTKAVMMPAEDTLLIDKSGLVQKDKPAKCYLAMHLEMIGAPFGTRVDATGAAHVCDADRSTARSQHDANPD